MALSNNKASTSAPLRKYHVFLSFRGTDTRWGITDRLFNELNDRAIITFRDDEKLERGTTIDEELWLAIRQSRYAIVIISKNYASSEWCLDELAYIVQCMKERGQIMPIFYGVKPSAVREQTGTFAKHFTEHENKFPKGSEKVREWRNALKKLGNIAGWELEDNRSGETRLINDIVGEVCRKIHPKFKGLGSMQKTDGLFTKLKNINSLLNPNINDIRFIGIWGTDEIGIETTAQLVYDNFSDNFQLFSFLKNIRKVSKDKSLVYLQAQLLEQLHGRSIAVSDVYQGKILTQNCVRNKKVLRILDDVDQSDQIEILAGEKDWYGAGSRIIITSTNPDLLKKHGIEEPYLLEGLNQDEALQLYN